MSDLPNLNALTLNQAECFCNEKWLLVVTWVIRARCVRQLAVPPRTSIPSQTTFVWRPVYRNARNQERRCRDRHSLPAQGLEAAGAGGRCDPGALGAQPCTAPWPPSIRRSE